VLVGGGGLVDGVVGVGELGGRVDEEAALEVRGVEPLVEHVEQREQLPPRVVARAPADRPAPRGRLPLVALADGRDHQGFLAVEVLVERRLRHPDVGHDPVEPDGVEPVRVEQLDRPVDEPLAPDGCHVGHPE
jgi:hypothetical protein